MTEGSSSLTDRSLSDLPANVVEQENTGDTLLNSRDISDTPHTTKSEIRQISDIPQKLISRPTVVSENDDSKSKSFVIPGYFWQKYYKGEKYLSKNWINIQKLVREFCHTFSIIQ